jgi:nitroimidazol reductase NimA-like FMN-containing flavoprotein (pyridoxamine 5'-phosphate oxidase superfamily)
MTTTGAPALADLDRDECVRLLEAGQIGRLVVLTTVGNTPVIRPVNYVFDEASQSVAFRCTEGTKLITLLHASRAWFEVDEIDVANRTGWSVLVAGIAEPVTARHEIQRLERLGLESWIAGPGSHWVRIRARVVSGRRIAASVPATESDT